MPKRIPKEQKRVSLNCLVTPATIAWLRSAEISQGEAVDLAVATTQIAQAQGRVAAYSPAVEQKIKANVTPRAFKGYIPKPSERKA